MPHFKCNARNAEGKLETRIIEAGDRFLAAKHLSNQGFTPLSVTETKPQADIFKQLGYGYALRNITLNDRMLFCRQMHSLTKAGVPLSRAFRSLIESTRNPAFADALRDIVRRLESGSALSPSMAHHKAIFSPLMVSIINVGENSGGLSEAFFQIGQYLQQEKETQSRIKSAFRYPSMVLVAISVAMIIVNIYVIPAFKTVFDSMHAELPWQTQLLLAVSDFTVTNGPFLAVSFALVIIGSVNYVRTPAGCLHWDRMLLALPGIGSIIQRSAMERFSRTLAMTLNAGVPIIQGITLVSDAVGNSYISAKLTDLRIGIEKGDSVSRMARSTNMFPPLVIQMLMVGEETGNISDMLLEVADFYISEVDAELKNLATAIEPILIVAIGVMVLILALGIFLPMWNLSSVMH